MGYIKLFESYFADLTQYNYGGVYDDVKTDPKLKRFFNYYDNHVNIGWLDKNHNFDKGYVPSNFLKKLNDKKVIFARHMGHHICDMCGDSFGSCVFRIRDGIKSYVFPEMLEHYIIKHRYLPPKEFIDVVIS